MAEFSAYSDPNTESGRTDDKLCQYRVANLLDGRFGVFLVHYKTREWWRLIAVFASEHRAVTYAEIENDFLEWEEAGAGTITERRQEESTPAPGTLPEEPSPGNVARLLLTMREELAELRALMMARTAADSAPVRSEASAGGGKKSNNSNEEIQLRGRQIDAMVALQELHRQGKVDVRAQDILRISPKFPKGSLNRILDSLTACGLTEHHGSTWRLLRNATDTEMPTTKAAAAAAAILGRIGGVKSARQLAIKRTPEERRAAARKASWARWKIGEGEEIVVPPIGEVRVVEPSESTGIEISEVDVESGAPTAHVNEDLVAAPADDPVQKVADMNADEDDLFDDVSEEPDEPQLDGEEVVTIEEMKQFLSDCGYKISGSVGSYLIDGSRATRAELVNQVNMLRRQSKMPAWRLA